MSYSKILGARVLKTNTHLEPVHKCHQGFAHPCVTQTIRRVLHVDSLVHKATIALKKQCEIISPIFHN